MKQRIRISFFILVFLVSLIPSVESQIKQINKQLTSFPTVIDAVKSEKINSLNNNGERTWLSAAQCGVGINMILLPPKEVVLSLMPVTRGNFSTELRLVYGKNHSSSFRGIIHYRQFESRFDKKGEFKEEYNQELEKRGK